MGGWERFNAVTGWMLKIAYLNILWVLFTIIGLVFLGLFPATGAMFAVVKKWFQGERQASVFQSFWKVYRSDFIRLNGFGLIFFTVGYFLYYDFTFLVLNQGSFQFLYPGLFFLLFVYLITLSFFFPVYVHFELTFLQYIRQSFLIAVTSPLETLQIALSAAAVYFLATLVPGIIPLFTGSVLACTINWISLRAFHRIRQKKQLN